MKHIEELLTIFLNDEQLDSPSSGVNIPFESASFGFLDSLFIRICDSRDINHSRDRRNASINNLPDVRQAVTSCISGDASDSPIHGLGRLQVRRDGS